MNFQEKRIIASLLNFILVTGGYILAVILVDRDGGFAGEDGMRLLGWMVLVMIGAGIVVTILLTILLNIAFAIAERDPDPGFIVDERDRMIEQEGMKVCSWVTGGGLVLAMGLLAAGMSVFLAINVIVVGFAAGAVAGGGHSLYLHRRGF